jgi:hypothetical protein
MLLLQAGKAWVIMYENNTDNYLSKIIRKVEKV